VIIYYRKLSNFSLSSTLSVIGSWARPTWLINYPKKSQQPTTIHTNTNTNTNTHDGVKPESILQALPIDIKTGDIAVLVGGLNAIDKELELLIDLLKGS